LGPPARPSRPHCVTATSIPQAAHTDSRFITAGFAPMTAERNTTSSSAIDSATTTAMSHGSRRRPGASWIDLRGLTMIA